MSIVKMKKLRAFVLREQRDELMRELMRLGCVQVREPDGLLADSDMPDRFRPEKAGLAAARTRQSQLQTALKILERYAPAKKKLLSARPEIRESVFLDEAALEEDLILADRIIELEEKVRQTEQEKLRLSNEIETLVPWEALDSPLDGAGTKTCGVALASSLAQTDMESVADAAESVTENVQIILVSDDEKQHCFEVIALREELPSVMEALRGAGCTLVSFPGLEGTARENILQRKKALEVFVARKDELTALIRAEGPKLASLKLSADRMAAEAVRAEAIERLSGTDRLVALEGWFPAADENRLKALFDRFDCAWETSEPAAEEYPDVPVTLKNRRLIKPMSLITEMYSMPAYDGIDPNPLMAPFFYLFYGIMMADMGYGLLMMLAAVVALKKMKPKGGTGYLIQLMGLTGVSTFVFGALTGGFFGDFLPQIAAMINPATTFTALPAAFNPLDDIMSIMVAALVIGVIQIFTGMIVSVVHKCKNGEGLNALFEEGTWWLILIGAALAVLRVGNIGGVPVILCLGGLLLVVGQFVEKKSLTGGLMGLFGAIYNNVTGYFSDILSYLRLMALMLAGAVIAQVFNQLGVMTGNLVLFILIAMVGNALNFALNLIGCFVHDLRLQVLEFFGRFYKDGGKPYRPLNIDPQYVDIIKEEI